MLHLQLKIHTIMHRHTHTQRHTHTHTHTFQVLCVFPRISPYLQLCLCKGALFYLWENLSFFCLNIETARISFRSMTRSRTAREKGKNTRKNNSLAFYRYFCTVGLRAKRCVCTSAARTADNTTGSKFSCLKGTGIILLIKVSAELQQKKQKKQGPSPSRHFFQLTSPS